MKYIKPKIKTKKILISSLLSDKNLFDVSTMEEGLLAGICFLPSTKVLMADNSKLDIEKIHEGDIVYAFNLKLNKLEKEEVVKVFVHAEKEVEYFIINETLSVTGNHPIWKNGVEWARVDSLKLNDWLINQKGQKVSVKSISKRSKTTAVYNLGLRGKNNNYFTEEILVHNRSVCPCGSTCNTSC